MIPTPPPFFLERIKQDFFQWVKILNSSCVVPGTLKEKKQVVMDIFHPCVHHQLQESSANSNRDNLSLILGVGLPFYIFTSSRIHLFLLEHSVSQVTVLEPLMTLSPPLEHFSETVAWMGEWTVLVQSMASWVHHLSSSFSPSLSLIYPLDPVNTPVKVRISTIVCFKFQHLHPQNAQVSILNFYSILLHGSLKSQKTCPSYSCSIYH